MASRSETLFARAREVIPGGVNSPVRSFKAVGRDPIFIARASGAWMEDVDGRRYIDYIGSWGPLILGHAPAEVVRAVQEAARRGFSFGAPTEAEVEMAERLRTFFPAVEVSRMVNSGTEATMSALRLARGFTGRTKLLKFVGCYHGHGDAFLVKAGSGALTLGVPDSPGVTPGVASDTLTARYNDLAAVQSIFAERGAEIAAVIVEPVGGNMGVVPPEPGFLEGLRQTTHEAGSLLIFDEVMTGFRVDRGGAQERYGVQPDLTTLGKIIGGGLPVGAYGGRREIMGQVSPAGPIYQAGTLSGNPLAMAAGLATLKALEEPNFYRHLEDKAQALTDGLAEIFREARRSVTINRVGSMFTVFFTSGPVRNFEEATASDTEAYAAFFRELLAEGVYFPPSQFEAAFVSAAHGLAEIDRTLEAVRRVVGRLPR